jgi:hypothetical protein
MYVYEFSQHDLVDFLHRLLPHLLQINKYSDVSWSKRLSLTRQHRTEIPFASTHSLALTPPSHSVFFYTILYDDFTFLFSVCSSLLRHSCLRAWHPQLLFCFFCTCNSRCLIPVWMNEMKRNFQHNARVRTNTCSDQIQQLGQK